MKKYSIILTAVFFGFLFYNFTCLNVQDGSIVPVKGELNMPADVKAIVDNSCYGCHHTDSKNEKGKKKLNFDSFGSDYSAIKSSGKLKEIAKVTMDGDMPPSKFLEHYPEKALDDNQRALINDWFRIEAKKYQEK
ncbi:MULTISPECIES: heme-binding domain-containing protein [unclassified Lentimicrobium]|uniref:heme-binding domain-containing protein n=1 Tax=unclassified Lentimicrobium TaxID=2677434 RepID=UPI001554C39F|nr:MULTISPECIES: heme-binding domain-containing protein [unclassified Lentimicrobium]NPD47022.1 hypothetical protein [Lentimicrobium sp. S6]NPD84843.1 hypothetical protein [Lentimicrobium sp. L6]